MTDRSVRVWARWPAGRVRATLSAERETLAEAEIVPDPAHDHVGFAVLRADKPRPASAFEVDIGGLRRNGRFAPSPGTPASFSFAFGSCHQPFSEPLDGGRVERHRGARIYPRIGQLLRERGAEFGLWLGDQVYSDAGPVMDIRARVEEDGDVPQAELVEAYRHLYRGFFNEAGYRQLAEALPAYLMWDDHDIFDGYGSQPATSPLERRLFEAAKKAYSEYQHLRNPGGGLDVEPPLGYSFWRADVGFHVADLRGERDFHRKQVMGEAGWRRLEDFLAEAADRQVPTVFLGLSVPVVHASPALMKALESLPLGIGHDVRDRWSVPHFAAQRTMLTERLFEWQAAVRGRRVIVLSGDVHVGAAFRVRSRRGHGRFTQWTSSALSTPDGLRHVLANQLITRFVRLGEDELLVARRGLATSNNVGVVEVAPLAGGGHRVSLSVQEYDGRMDRLRLGLSDVAV